ncbi:MAG: serine protease [candidate division SR1 bacterium]|nr:serine protease [candidate division SR1 bacterium]
MYKKIFFGLTAAIVLSALFCGVSTYASTSTASSVFKIQAYSYNSVSEKYELQQYGSAVLVAKNTLLTNAHVVTDDDNNFTLQYEACQTLSSSESPTCFSTLQLLSYDKNADLALLKIVTPSATMPDPVVLGSGTLSVGSAISIIGYPANGGDSITTTQGTIAGYEQGYYKTDANIDGGNSGGGGFDGAGNFIGIPTFVVNGQTTLGYLIPIDTIKAFLAGDIGSAATQKVAPAFTKWLASQYGFVDVKNISNTLFSTPDFSDYGISLIDSTEKKNNNLYEYILENDNTSQVRLQDLIASDDAAIQKYINNAMKVSKAKGMTTQKMTKKIGNISFQVMIGMDEDIVIYEYIQTHSTNKTYLDFVVLVDRGDVKADLSNLLSFVEAVTIKKSTTKPQVLNLPGVTLSSKREIGIVKGLNNGSLNIMLFPTSDKFVINLSAYPASKGMTIKKVMTNIEGLLDDNGIEYTTETSKYPSKLLFVTTTDENNNVSMIAIGTVKSGSATVFIRADVNLSTATNKKEAIAMFYKIFGME